MNCPYQKKNKPGTGLNIDNIDNIDRVSQSRELEVKRQDFNDEICEFAGKLLLSALDGHDPAKIKSAAEQLKDCSTCKNMLDLQLKIRNAMSMQLKTKAPANLRIQISQNLRRMNLGELDISDFYPPPSR